MHPEEEQEPQDEEANWSEQAIPAKHRQDILAKVPRAVRRAVRQAHKGLGHPSQATFRRMLKLGGATQMAQLYARFWQCPVCAESAPPRQMLRATPELRPYGFNVVVVVDIKYLKDADNTQLIALSMVDAGTAWHVVALLRNRSAKHVAKKLLSEWFKHYGAPDTLILDQGGEFEGIFIALLEQYGIDSKTTAANAGWQHGIAERHGGLLGTLWAKMVHEFGIRGRTSAGIALSAIAQAKNATMTRNGMTPEQAVFGRSLAFGEQANRDDDEVVMSSLGSHGVQWKATQIRSAARMALIQRDATEKVRRAMLRQAPTVVGVLCPGSRVYFWSPNPFKARRRQDPERWRGPATVIAKEMNSRYYLSWRGQCVLVAREQIRLASSVETAAAEHIKEDARLVGGGAEDKSYKDVSDPAATPRISKKVKKPFLKGPSRMRQLTGQSRREPPPLAEGAAGSSSGPRAPQPEPPTEQVPVPPPVEVEADNAEMPGPAPVTEDLDDKEQWEKKRKFLKDLQDDVPHQFKRRKIQDEPPTGLASMQVFAMTACVHTAKDEWLDADQLDGLSSLLRRTVRGACVHPIARRRLYGHERHRDCCRLSVMLTEDGRCLYKDDSENRDNSKMDFLWKGITIFYHALPDSSTKATYYLDSPAGMIKQKLNYEEWLNTTSVYEQWNKDIQYQQLVYQLTLKQNAKELDPTKFDQVEAKAFDAADAAEWRQWIMNETVELVPEEMENSIPKQKIIATPMRMVRVNRGSPDKLEAKSRLVIPGHRDPEIGLFRTDSPTTSTLAVRVAAVISVAMDWNFEVFDVMTAFLSGKELDRELYVRAPKEGLPSPEDTGWPSIHPYKLLRLLKGAYGLTEAPRLWYLRARQILVETIGFEELRCARAVFTFRKGNRLIAILTLHVDDGMLFGKSSSREYQNLKAEINTHFKIKHWKQSSSTISVDYLGEQWLQHDEYIEIHMDKYIKALQKCTVSRREDGERLLTEMEIKDYRSLLAKARWPIARLAPQLAYSVSALAQSTKDGRKLLHMRALNEVVDRLQEANARGEATLKVRRVPLKDLQVLTLMDASFAQEVGSKSQMGFMSMLTSSDVQRGPEVCNLVEFQSNTITRVVGSTMAAESAAMSIALDRQLYLRLLVEGILYGEPDLRGDWRMKLKVPGYLVTDAKSLFDHVSKVGSLPVPRQTLIDLLVARDLIEQEAIKFKWMPNSHMLADILTKAVAPNEVVLKFLRTGMFSLVPTEEQEIAEQRRLWLRRGQRNRAKEKKKAKKQGASSATGLAGQG